MFWLYKGDKPGGPNLAGLYYWDQVTGVIDRIASQAQSWDNQRFPQNAAFYRLQHFIFRLGHSRREHGQLLPITYDVSGNPMGVGNRIQRTITGPTFSPDFMNVGDIVIKTSTTCYIWQQGLEGDSLRLTSMMHSSSPRFLTQRSRRAISLFSLHLTAKKKSCTVSNSSAAPKISVTIGTPST